MSSLGVDLDQLPAEIRSRLEGRARTRGVRLRIGRYLIIGELGRGGMGVVYDAWDPRIDRRVAVKTVEPDLIPDEAEREEVIERFRREIKVVGRLRHPAIVTIFDYGEEPELRRGESPNAPGRIYYHVMEYLEGRSLARVLRERRSLPDLEATLIAADIADALCIAHANGVIHRDVKPSNVFIRNDGRAVLLDFGIAKTPSPALTKQGQILGTPTYLAPERLREKEDGLDGRADLFSLGVLLYTMLEGEAPFTGASVQDLLDNITKQSHSRLDRSSPGGQALSSVIDRMLAKRPRDRYSTAEEAVEALRQARRLLQTSGGRPFGREGPDTSAEMATPSEPLPVVAGNRIEAQGTSPEVALVRETRRLLPDEGGRTLSAPQVVEITETHNLDDPDIAPLARDPSDLAGMEEEEGTDSAESQRQWGQTDAATDPPPPPRRVASVEGEDETIAEPDGMVIRRPPRAGAAEHSEQATEQAPSVTRAPTKTGTMRRPRIEASLVDEEDVVVKPAALESLKPDEMPTQTGYPALTPAPEPIARPGDPVETDIVRQRKSVRDPAEVTPKKSSSKDQPAPQAKAPEPAAESSAEDSRSGGSAAVARRTFGVGAAPGRRPGRNATPRPEDYKAIRVTGTDFEVLGRRGRLFRTRIVLLLTTGLGAVALGIMLGRIRTQKPDIQKTPAAQEKTTVLAPRALAEPKNDGQPPLVAPPPASDLLAEGNAALAGGRLEEADRVYARVLEESDEGTEVHTRALLGRGRVLVAQGEHERAEKALQHVVALGADTPEAREARAVLATIPPTRRPAPAGAERLRTEPARLPPPRAEAPAPAAAAPDLGPEGSDEERCKFLIGKYLGNATAGVAAFEELRAQIPDAPCVYKQLGTFQKKAGNDRAAISAWRHYLSLRPNAPDRKAIEGKIAAIASQGP